MIYIRKAHYHETDQMGIIHHSNYFKWFEEARIEMMAKIGVPYKYLENEGVISPVLGISCDYKNMVKFDDDVHIHVNIKEYNGVKLLISYEVKNQIGDKLYAIGESKHCFLNENTKIVSLKKLMPKVHEKFILAMV